MDGTIEVESKVGKGTTFRLTFTLPTAEEGSVRRDEVQEPVRLPARGVNVLVAEDNALNYEIVVEQLSSYGLHCRRAKDGRDCVRAVLNARSRARSTSSSWICRCRR